MSADPRSLLPKTFAVLDGMIRAGSINADDWLPIDRAMRAALLNGAPRRILQVAKRGNKPLTDAARHGSEWRDKNPHKQAANTEVGGAIRYGLIVPKPCEACGCDADVHAHHDDYAKPLDVRWLCRSCHQKLHRAA